ncbi:MAG: tetratricopeptide repeat protein [Acidobacteria bacterium]|nr:tetratricopeptide repeat protein [Acidobacteriota bacterium]
MRELLRYVVETALDRDVSQLKELTLAIDVFDKPNDFDVRLNPIVRVEARRLRSRLLEYYSQEGKDDPVVIHLPRGGYAPQFECRAPAVPVTRETVRKSAQRRKKYQAVVVLPFVDLSPEGGHQRFCDGLTEEVINALTRVKGLEVVARSSAFQFQGSAQDVREVGERLGVRMVMEGSVRLHGSKVRVTVQLANANNGFHLWSATYDAEIGEIFVVQEEIAAKVAATMRRQRAETSSHELTKRQSRNTNAYQAYLEGVYHSRQFRDRNLASAIGFFEAAIDIDSQYAQAYAGLAKCYCDLAWLNLKESALALEKAKTLASKALELDQTDAGAAALAALGCVACIGDWRYEDGKQQLLLALDEDPGEYFAYQWYALGHLAPLGDHEEALRVIQRGAERSGNSLVAQNRVGVVHFYAGDYPEAIRSHRRVIDENPDYAQAWFDLGRAYLARERFGEAHEALSKAVTISGGRPLFLGRLGFCEAAMGDLANARKTTTNLVKLSKEQTVSPVAVAHAFLGLGSVPDAFEWLRLALDRRCCRLIELDNDPIYDAIREEEEFQKLRIAVCLVNTDETVEADSD